MLNKRKILSLLRIPVPSQRQKFEWQLYSAIMSSRLSLVPLLYAGRRIAHALIAPSTTRFLCSYKFEWQLTSATMRRRLKMIPLRKYLSPLRLIRKEKYETLLILHGFLVAIYCHSRYSHYSYEY